MNLINIKQINNNQADEGALIVHQNGLNLWTNQDNTGILVPSGTTSERPTSPLNGHLRYNTDLSSFEFYQNDSWVRLDNITLSSLSNTGINIITTVSSNREIIQRTLLGGGAIELSARPDGVVVVSAAQFIQNITTSSFGGGAQIALGVSANREIQFRTITGGGIVDVTQVGNTINISASRHLTLSSLGTGILPVVAISADREIIQRTLVGGGGIELSADSNGNIIISASPSLSIPNITVSSLSISGYSFITNVSSLEIHQRQILEEEFIQITSTQNTINIRGIREVSYLVTQNSHGFSQGQVVYLDNDDNTWKLALAASADTLGVAFVNKPTTNTFEAVFAGILSGFDDLKPGNYYFVSNVNPGQIQINEPNTSYSNPVLYAVASTIGMVLPYRPSEITDDFNFIVSISGVGPVNGADILRNVENNTEIIYRRITSTSSIVVTENTNSVELSVLSQNLNIPVKFSYFSGNFDNPNNTDWKIDNVAAAVSDPLYNSLTVRHFPKSFFTSASPYRGVGGIFRVPDSQYKYISFEMVFRPSTTITATAQTRFYVYFRRIPNYNIINPWFGDFYDIEVKPNPTTPIVFQYNRFISEKELSSFGLDNNIIFQFEIMREYDNVNDTLTTGLYLLEFSIIFT